MPGAMELPCLAFHQCGRSTPLFSASEQKRKVVLPTARGHLLVRDIVGDLPLRPTAERAGDKIFHLPPLRGIDDSTLMDSYCLLSGDPTAPGCVVLLVDPDDTVIRYVHPGDDQWVEHDYDAIGTTVLDHEDDLYQKDVICPVAACSTSAPDQCSASSKSTTRL